MSEVNPDQTPAPTEANKYYRAGLGLAGAGLLAFVAWNTPSHSLFSDSDDKSTLGKIGVEYYIIDGVRPPIHEDRIEVEGKNKWVGKFGILHFDQNNLTTNFDTTATFYDCTSTAVAFDPHHRGFGRIETDIANDDRTISYGPSRVIVPSGDVFECRASELTQPAENDFNLGRVLKYALTYEGAHPANELKFTTIVQETA